MGGLQSRKRVVRRRRRRHGLKGGMPTRDDDTTITKVTKTSARQVAQIAPSKVGQEDAKATMPLTTNDRSVQGEAPASIKDDDSDFAEEEEEARLSDEGLTEEEEARLSDDGLTDEEDDGYDDDLARTEEAESHVPPPELFTNGVVEAILGKLEDSKQFTMLRETWSKKYERTLSVVSRDWLASTIGNTVAFTDTEVERNICRINPLYVKRSFWSMFGIVDLRDEGHDMLCVLSKLSDDPYDQSEWKLEAFVIGALHRSGDPAWWLSLVCNGNLRGIALSLVQSFVYAVKCYAEAKKVHAKIFLELSSSYKNVSAMIMYARTGFSSFSPLVLDVHPSATAPQRVVTTQDLITCKAKHYMAIDLALFDKSVLLSNIGVLTPTNLSIDSIYCDLAKVVDTQSVFARRTLREAQDKFSDLMTRFLAGCDPQVFAEKEATFKAWLASQTSAKTRSIFLGFKEAVRTLAKFPRFSPL